MSIAAGSAAARLDCALHAAALLPWSRGKPAGSDVDQASENAMAVYQHGRSRAVRLEPAGSSNSMPIGETVIRFAPRGAAQSIELAAAGKRLMRNLRQRRFARLIFFC